MSSTSKAKASLLWGIVALLAALLVVPLGGAATARPDGGRELRQVKVAILPLEPAAQAMYAKERGFFARQGLDVEITVLSNPAQTPAALASGDVQFAAFNVGGLASAKSQGAPFRALASGALFDPAGVKTSALVAMPNKRIRSARDLVGKLVAIDQLNTIAHVGVLKWLKENGVSKDDVRFTSLPFADMLGPLTRGQFDAALLPEPYLTQALSRGARLVSYPFDALCSEPCLLTMWVARKDIDGDLAARYRNAIQAASVWANQKRNRAASARILAKYVPMTRALLGKIRRTTFATRLRPRLAQPWIDVYAEFGLIPKSFPAADLIR